MKLEKEAKIVHGDAKNIDEIFRSGFCRRCRDRAIPRPLIKELPTMPEAIKTIKDLEDLYTKTLKSIHHLLKDGIVVFIIPKITDCERESH